MKEWLSLKGEWFDMDQDIEEQQKDGWKFHSFSIIFDRFAIMLFWRNKK